MRILTGDHEFFDRRRLYHAQKRRKRVALLIETSNAYARGLLRGIYSYVREQAVGATYFPELSRGDPPPKSLKRWHGDGIIARIENQQIAEVVGKLNIPVVDVSETRAAPEVPWVRRMTSR